MFCFNTKDFQIRRTKICIRDGDKNMNLHILDGLALTVGRYYEKFSKRR